MLRMSFSSEIYYHCWGLFQQGWIIWKIGRLFSGQLFMNKSGEWCTLYLIEKSLNHFPSLCKLLNIFVIGWRRLVASHSSHYIWPSCDFLQFLLKLMERVRFFFEIRRTFGVTEAHSFSAYRRSGKNESIMLGFFWPGVSCSHGTQFNPHRIHHLTTPSNWLTSIFCHFCFTLPVHDKSANRHAENNNNNNNKGGMIAFSPKMYMQITEKSALLYLVDLSIYIQDNFQEEDSDHQKAVRSYHRGNQYIQWPRQGSVIFAAYMAPSFLVKVLW